MRDQLGFIGLAIIFAGWIIGGGLYHREWMRDGTAYYQVNKITGSVQLCMVSPQAGDKASAEEFGNHPPLVIQCQKLRKEAAH